MKKILSMVLSLAMIFSMSSTAFASSGESAIRNFSEEIDAAISSDTDVTRSAGLAWGPITIGNVKLYMTNIHLGYVPGFAGQVSHVNFHADNADTGRAIINYHIVKYTSGDKECLYVYDSVSGNVIIRSCFGGWTDAVSAVVESIKSAVQAVLSEADWLATIAIWGVIIIVVADLIIPMDPIPVIPFSIEPTISEHEGRALLPAA